MSIDALVKHDVTSTATDVSTTVVSTLDVPLFKLGGAQMTVGSLSGALIALLMLLIFSRWLRFWLLNRVLARGHIDIGTRETLATLARYGVLVFGVMAIFQAVGISLSSFTVLVGALGVGIGFGLQNIFSNFISGLIVMFERPIKIGDHISVAGAEGDVVEIGARATTLLTAQHTKVIVPNQAMITGNVVNWALQPATSASIIPLRLSGDVRKNEKILLGVAASVDDVLAAPAPAVFLTSVDHAGYSMELHFWLSGSAAERLSIANQVNRNLMDALAANNVTMVGAP